VLILHPAWAAGLLSVIGQEPTWHFVKGNGDGSVYVRT
jgi:hypothetical protein